MCENLNPSLEKSLLKISNNNPDEETNSKNGMVFKHTYFVYTSAAMVASSVKAFVDIDLAEDANGTMRTCTFEIIHQIVTYTIVLTRIRVAIIDVELAVFTLITLGTSALIGANEIFASCSVLTRVIGAFVNFVLTIASIIAVSTDAFVTVTIVSAMAIILA